MSDSDNEPIDWKAAKYIQRFSESTRNTFRDNLDSAAAELRDGYGTNDSGQVKFQKQHVIPAQLKGERAIRMLDDIDFDHFDFGTNGMWLPSDPDLAHKLGMSQHSGPHPAYSEFVSRILDEIAGEYEDGGGSDRSKADAKLAVAKLQVTLMDLVTDSLDPDKLENGFDTQEKRVSLTSAEIAKLDPDSEAFDRKQDFLRDKFDQISLTDLRELDVWKNHEKYLEKKHIIYDPHASGTDIDGVETDNFLGSNQRALAKCLTQKFMKDSNILRVFWM